MPLKWLPFLNSMFQGDNHFGFPFPSWANSPFDLGVCRACRTLSKCAIDQQLQLCCCRTCRTLSNYVLGRSISCNYVVAGRVNLCRSSFSVDQSAACSVCRQRVELCRITFLVDQSAANYDVAGRVELCRNTYSVKAAKQS